MKPEGSRRCQRDSTGSVLPLAVWALAGCLTTGIVVLMLLGCVGYRIGFSSLLNQLWKIVVPTNASTGVRLPGPLLRELEAMGAVVEGAGNPTSRRPHDTLLVRPDSQLGWVLRPGIRLIGYVLGASQTATFDPPVLFVPEETALSEPLQRYLSRAVLRYRLSTDADGFRTTLPVSTSGRKILLVGDSVLFGMGVSDEETMASHLQRLVGEAVRVVNGGVGGYDGAQAAEMARRRSVDHYDTLIYVACQNDFMLRHGVTYSAQAKAILRRFASLKAVFGGRVIVLLQTSLEYAAHDVLLDQGWSQGILAGTDALRTDVPVMAKTDELISVDWMDAVREDRRESGTVLSTFALYADHAHLSPRGNRLAAEQLYRALQAAGVVGREAPDGTDAWRVDHRKNSPLTYSH